MYSEFFSKNRERQDTQKAMYGVILKYLGVILKLQQQYYCIKWLVFSILTECCLVVWLVVYEGTVKIA